MILKTLIDDQALDGYACEHGLCFWISANGKNILFDFGKTDLFLQNAKNKGSISQTSIWQFFLMPIMITAADCAPFSRLTIMPPSICAAMHLSGIMHAVQMVTLRTLDWMTV